MQSSLTSINRINERWSLVIALVMVILFMDLKTLAEHTITSAKAEITDDVIRSHEENFYIERVFHVLDNMMNSTNLTFVINCVNKDYFRYEFAIKNVLKRTGRPYAIIQLESVSFSQFMSTAILQRLSTTGDMWYDIFMLCWDDGRDRVQSLNGSASVPRTNPLEELIEIFREESRDFGNVRWIFWTWTHIMKKIQTMCGVIYVNISRDVPLILSEPMDLIRKCGGRIVFVDLEDRVIDILRNPLKADTSIFKHEIDLSHLTQLRVLCGTLDEKHKPVQNYCNETPQKEILNVISRRISLELNFSTAMDFGSRLVVQDTGDGQHLKIGKFDGLIGDLQQRLFDINAVNVFPTEDLQDAVTFTSSYYRFDLLTIFVPPAILQFGTFKVIWMPFQSSVWVTVAATIIGTCSILSLFLKITFGDSWFFHNLFYMSLPMTPRLPLLPAYFYRELPLSVLLATWLLGSFLISLVYSGVLTSFRQHPPTTDVIDTLHKLEKILSEQDLKSSQSRSDPPIKVAFFNSSKYRAILNPNASSFMSLARNHSEPCDALKECIDLVIKRTHVFLSTDFTVKWVAGTDEKGRVVERAKDNINAGRYSITLQKGSPIQNQVTRVSQNLFEIGAFERFEKLENYMIKPSYNNTNIISPYSVITTTDIKGLLQLYGIGNALGLAAVLLEKYFRGGCREVCIMKRHSLYKSNPPRTNTSDSWRQKLNGRLRSPKQDSLCCPTWESEIEKFEYIKQALPLMPSESIPTPDSDFFLDPPVSSSSSSAESRSDMKKRIFVFVEQENHQIPNIIFM